MRDAILIGTAPDGTKTVLSGPGHPDPIKAKFKELVRTPVAGVVAIELWDSTSGRIKRAKLDAPAPAPATEPAPAKKKSSTSKTTTSDS